MASVKMALGARTQLVGAAAALNSLASGAYAKLGTITHNVSGKVPLDCMVELTATPGTVSGNQQLILFAKISMDGTQITSGPESGTDSTNERNLYRIGSLPLNTNGGSQRDTFSLAASLPGNVLPYATILIVKNDSGATLSNSVNDVYTQDYNGDVT